MLDATNEDQFFSNWGVNAADLTERGLLGDRAYALIDTETGKIGRATIERRILSMKAIDYSFPRFCAAFFLTSTDDRLVEIGESRPASSVPAEFTTFTYM